MAPHLGGYNPAVPQPSYQQRDQTSYPYSQSQQSSQPAAPHANAYSFHANAHGVTGSAVNHAALAGYGNNTHHMAIPPPPYPPVPIPFGPSPYVPSHSTQPHPISDGASHHNFMPLGPLDTHPDSVQNINGEGSNHFTPPISELEDGEVNDGEGDELARTQGVAKMGSSFSRQSQAAQNARENPTAGAPNYSSLKRLEEASSGPTQGMLLHVLRSNLTWTLNTNGLILQSQVFSTLNISPFHHRSLGDLQLRTVLSTIYNRSRRNQHQTRLNTWRRPKMALGELSRMQENY